MTQILLQSGKLHHFVSTILRTITTEVNQIGTVTEEIEVLKMTKDAEWGVVISQRSGETDDCFVADLVVDLAIGQIKAGASSCESKVKEKQNQIQTIPVRSTGRT
ncbi:hypothetical protein L2E82_38696 [Cichorium intybus]|uniref:Uncharacterized protein n=1 Tax=Cichorium intybus TaxID=13427 RepID=A0ACB9AGC5_CICIN|nr:hypothetical protein L2E82_38696 [Cichorium intybus]